MSSFGPNAQTQQAMGQLGTNAGTTGAYGGGLLNLGTQNTNSGANLFRSLLNGNQAEGTAALSPDINRIRQAQQGTLQAVSTLMPRGGARSGTLFDLPFAANRQIQNLFNPLRSSAAGQLAQIGQGQTNSGANLFGVSNQGAGQLGDLGQKQQQISSSLWGGLGKGLLGLATLPFGGFGTLLSRI